MDRNEQARDRIEQARDRIEPNDLWDGSQIPVEMRPLYNLILYILQSCVQSLPLPKAQDHDFNQQCHERTKLDDLYQRSSDIEYQQAQASNGNDIEKLKTLDKSLKKVKQLFASRVYASKEKLLREETEAQMAAMHPIIHNLVTTRQATMAWIGVNEGVTSNTASLDQLIQHLENSCDHDTLIIALALMLWASDVQPINAWLFTWRPRYLDKRGKHQDDDSTEDGGFGFGQLSV